MSKIKLKINIIWIKYEKIKIWDAKRNKREIVTVKL